MQFSNTRQLGILAVGATLALSLMVGFAPYVRADTATTTGTTTRSYVFDTHLTGENQVPSVAATTSTTTSGLSTTTGHARVWFDMTNATGSATTTTSMWQWLGVWNGDDVTAAHLHCGLPGANGPVVLDMYHPSASSTDVNGTLVASSTVGASNLHATTTGCSMPITSLTELGNALKAGIIYANVHSLAYPSGVVRGQMMLTSSSSMSTSTTTPPMGTTTPPGGGHGTTTPPGGTTTPHLPGLGGLGSSINDLIAKLFGRIHVILENFIPEIPNLPGVRTERTAR